MNRWFSLVIAHLLITMNEVHSEQLFTKLELQVMKNQENSSMNTKAATLSLSDLPSSNESDLWCLCPHRLPTSEQRNHADMQDLRTSCIPTQPQLHLIGFISDFSNLSLHFKDALLAGISSMCYDWAVFFL